MDRQRTYQGSGKDCLMDTVARERSNVAALERWKMLKKAIFSAISGPGYHSEASHFDELSLQAISVRSFTSFELFQITEIEREKANGSLWKLYSTEDSIDSCSTKTHVCGMVKLLPQKLSLDSLTGFNNTGNVCIWPSEEVMAYYCLRQREKFKGKSVCELGGGMTGLAGLMLSLTGMPSLVRLTDGNPTSVSNMQQLIKANGQIIDISAELLVWNQEFLDSQYPVFDYVICADCLFFTELHSCLVQVIYKLLSPGGEALLFNPRRSGTLQQFSWLVAADGKLRVEEKDKYEEEVWKRHERLCVSGCIGYKPDLHYPVMLRLTHSKP